MVLGLTPKNVPAVTLLPWQASHPLLMPLWLNAEPENFAPLPMGVDAILELAPTWQLSQPSAPMGMWLATEFCVTMGLTVVDAAYNAAFAALWHWAQLVLVDWILA
jgi:hypothetical protein